MLKVQLSSKLFQLDPSWAEIEDVLTGDFFGSLDYLPREPFLRSFVEFAAAKMDNKRLSTEGINWDEAELLFWLRGEADGKPTEPDVILVTNRWILVIEVKLRSGLGKNQPWREFVVGRKLAMERGLPADAVYYAVLTRDHVDVAATFSSQTDADCRHLLSRTAQLRWWQIVALVDTWLADDTVPGPLDDAHHRLIVDLQSALRRRRLLSFSGFELVARHCTRVLAGPFFSPPRFAGFLIASQAQIAASDFVYFESFSGFLLSAPQCDRADDTDSMRRFDGFLQTVCDTHRSTEPTFLSDVWGGFLYTTPRTTSSGTLIVSS